MVKTYSDTFSINRLWLVLVGSLVVMFATLLFFGYQIYQERPPTPLAYQTTGEEVIFERQDIQRGQSVWQSIGGMQQGSIWGHGGYLAPDWTADWIQREAEALLEQLAAQFSQDTDSQSIQNILSEATLKDEMRTNTYSVTTETVTIGVNRAEAIQQVTDHYIGLFRGDADFMDLRRDYAFPLHQSLSTEDARALSAFVFWTAWAAVTERPGDEISYTSNWPHYPLVGNTPSPAVFMWSFFSILLLLGGIGWIVWYYARQYDHWRHDQEPESGFATIDFMENAEVTSSMRATAKYFWLVTLLLVGQVLLGIVTAHFAVERQGLYGLPFIDYLPYVVTRTWHTQLALMWIATAWLATGLYVAPLISGHEPRLQRSGVNFLFISLVVIVVGSFAGQWLAVHGHINDLAINFWFGHQGYEYIDLGRAWQIYLFVGLILWVTLILRAIWPALKRGENRSLIFLLIVATVSIGLLYGAGLMWGQQTHITIMEYWRWWVVHLWVEGVFEVFATAIISTLFVRMGLLRVKVATTMVLFATIIFLGGGVLGTFHHLYWSGTPVGVLALGASFSALEVVPLIVVGFEAYNHARIEKQALWERAYYWPFRFFMAVLFWNMVGAGLFGFLINPPIALYYMQGLNTTANHGHAALFGVYGMLGIGLMLYCLRGLTNQDNWNHRLFGIAFWSLNIGLAMMTFLSLLPQGLWQTYASIKHHYAYARSAEFVHSTAMEAFVWARVPGDIVFSIGVGALALAVFMAFATGSLKKSRRLSEA